MKYFAKLPLSVYTESILPLSLKEFDLESTTEERKKHIIEEIIEKLYYHLNFNYPKPSNIQLARIEDESSSNEEKHSDRLDEKIFSPNLIIEEYLKRPEDPSILNQISMN